MGKQTKKVDELTIESAADGPAHKRVKILQYTTMLKLYSDIIQDYNETLIKYHEKCTALLQQQRLLIRRQISSEEFEELMDAQETSLFVDNILVDIQITKQQLSDMETRHKEVKKLEKSITEIRDMFVDVAFLIQEQGEQINSVEFFAGKTIDNIDSGGQDLKEAKKKSAKLKKRKIKIACILVTIIIILIFIAAYF